MKYFSEGAGELISQLAFWVAFYLETALLESVIWPFGLFVRRVLLRHVWLRTMLAPCCFLGKLMYAVSRPPCDQYIWSVIAICYLCAQLCTVNVPHGITWPFDWQVKRTVSSYMTLTVILWQMHNAYNVPCLSVSLTSRLLFIYLFFQRKCSNVQYTIEKGVRKNWYSVDNGKAVQKKKKKIKTRDYILNGLLKWCVHVIRPVLW